MSESLWSGVLGGPAWPHRSGWEDGRTAAKHVWVPNALPPCPPLLPRSPAVECDCCPRRYTCLHHAAQLCGCGTSRRRLAYRHTLQELEGALAAVEARVEPGGWGHMWAKTLHLGISLYINIYCDETGTGIRGGAGGGGGARGAGWVGSAPQWVCG